MAFDFLIWFRFVDCMDSYQLLNYTISYLNEAEYTKYHQRIPVLL